MARYRDSRTRWFHSRFPWYTTLLAKTNRPDVKMPLCERSRFIRPHQDTPSSIIRHYISRYSTTQFHWIYPSTGDKKEKKKRKQVGGRERENSDLWLVSIGLPSRCSNLVTENWAVARRLVGKTRSSLFLSHDFYHFFFLFYFPSPPSFFYRISIIESKVIPKDSLEKQATRIGGPDYRSKIY